MSNFDELADFLIQKSEAPFIPDVRFSVTFTPEENKRLEAMAHVISEKKTRLVSMAAMELVEALEKKFNLTDSDEYKKLIADPSVNPLEVVYTLKINGIEGQFFGGKE